MRTPIARTNFSCQQTDRVQNQGPNDCEEEMVDDGDELDSLRGRIGKDMKNGHEDDYPAMSRFT
jgi:hypothetical protein